MQKCMAYSASALACRVSLAAIHDEYLYLLYCALCPASSVTSVYVHPYQYALCAHNTAYVLMLSANTLCSAVLVKLFSSSLSCTLAASQTASLHAFS